MVLGDVAVVIRKHQAEGGARCKGNSLSYWNVCANLRLYLDVVRGAPERHLEIIPQEDAFVGVIAVIAKVELREKIRIENHQRRQVVVERILVCEGALDLGVVAEA